MSKELIQYLNLKQGQTVLDCTVGLAGHADLLLETVGSSGRFIGLDQDRQALEIAENKLKRFNNCVLIQDNFRNINKILDKLSVSGVDAIVFDLGISSLQLDQASRGFSIRLEGPLDMRMDRDLRFSAFDLVNFLPEEKLSKILKEYGQERWHNRIARTIVRERKHSPIVTTGQLANLVNKVTPGRYTKIHPATRTFQALRIAVNDELAALWEGLNKCIDYLRQEARICVISFHSLEDRIVKNEFRKFSKMGLLKIITKKPIRPTEDEVSDNPRARSARMRVAERTNATKERTD